MQKKTPNHMNETIDIRNSIMLQIAKALLIRAHSVGVQLLEKVCGMAIAVLNILVHCFSVTPTKKKIS